MAGDWIKMRVSLTTNPRVLRIAECLLENGDFLAWSGLAFGMRGYPPTPAQRSERHAALRVTRYVTVTALLRFWGYANEHAKGEEVAGVFPEDVDEITGVPGFGAAIEAAGWVQFDPDGGMSMPNFNEHNTSAEARSGGAERQARYRQRQKKGHGGSDITRDVTVTPREEKRREEALDISPHTDRTISSTGPDSAPADACGSFEGHEGPDCEALQIGLRLVRASTDIRAAGCPDCSPSDAHLIAALGDGITEAELVDLARQKPGKGIAYLCRTARGKRADAAANGGAVPAVAGSTRNTEGPSPRLSPAEEAARKAEALAAQERQFRELGMH